MKNRALKYCTAFLLLIVMFFQMTATAHAASVKPDDTATRENVLEVLLQYDADAHHILTTASGMDFMIWFMGQSIISGIDSAVHETYHLYTSSQRSGFYGENIYLGDGKSYDVDYSIVYNGGAFTKTEEMSKQIPSHLRTFRYDQYVAPGASADANTKGVFGLLNEFTAYYWGLETMNSLAQFLIDTDSGADAWGDYVSSIGNNMTAYAEFKYWTLRYMLYIKSANPTLYQAILNNTNYCAAYRDADAAFSAEIERSREIVNNSAEFMSAKGFSVDWSDTGVYLTTGSSNSDGTEGFAPWEDDFFSSLGFGDFGPSFSSGMGLGLEDYNSLMAELKTAEYIEMDSVLKKTPSNPPAQTPDTSFADTPSDSWYYTAVQWAVENNITNGTGTNPPTFTPMRECKQVEILTFLWRANGEPSGTVQLPFTPQNAYAEGALRWGFEKGMIDASFDENAPCTRATAVKFIWQASDSPSASGVSFIDVPAGADYAQAVAWAVEKGITNGTNTNPPTFSPNKTCNRAEIVTFLYRDRTGKT